MPIKFRKRLQTLTKFRKKFLNVYYLVGKIAHSLDNYSANIRIISYLHNSETQSLNI